ncbi:ABC transporter permease [Candidatus Woesearchaeota archaeon]|nr:ABC transporter permease [Candidatus Woesearchaeota archaeon]
MIKDYTKFAFRTFKVRGIRTFLTMLGIFVGIAAIVSLISLGQGLENAITEQFEMLGTNKIIVSPAGTFFGFGGEASSDLTEDDLDIINKVKGVKTAGGMLYKFANVKFGNEIKYTFVIGLPLDESGQIIQDMSGFDVEKGRDLKEGDKYKVTVGDFLAQGDFFEKKVQVRDKIEIEGQEFSVIGQVARIGNPADDSQVYIPMETARELFDEPLKLDFIMLEGVKGIDMADLAEDIEKDLRKHRGVKEGEEDFNVQTFEELMDTYSTILVIVQAVLIGIASISLLVGGVGIMNTMYTSVLERTNEIGVMKAIGAQNKDILAIFLIESGFLGLIGGVIGILIGVGIGKLVEFGAAQQGLDILKASFPWYLILGALLFSFLVGAISGVAPARQASKLKPVDALRYE